MQNSDSADLAKDQELEYILSNKVSLNRLNFSNVIDSIFNWNYTTERALNVKKELNSSDDKKKSAHSEEIDNFIHLINNSCGRESIVNALKRWIPNSYALLHMLSARSELFKRVAICTRKELEIISSSEGKEKITKVKLNQNEENPSQIALQLDIRYELMSGIDLNASKYIQSLVSVLLKLGPRQLQVGATSQLKNIESFIKNARRQELISKEEYVNAFIALGVASGRIRYFLNTSYELLDGMRKKKKLKNKDNIQKDNDDQRKKQIKSLLKSISSFRQLKPLFIIDVDTDKEQWKQSIIKKQEQEISNKLIVEIKDELNNLQQGERQKNIKGVDTDGKYIFVLNDENKLKCIGTGNQGTELGREYKEIEIIKVNKEEITENKSIQILG
ncbi:MAG: hypothetical protein EZS28_003188, partial [Streblomastix strix]